MGKTRQADTAEYRRQILAVAKSGRFSGELAEELEPSEQTIQNWLFQFQVDAGDRSDGITTAEKDESGSCAARIGHCARSARS